MTYQYGQGFEKDLKSLGDLIKKEYDSSDFDPSFVEEEIKKILKYNTTKLSTCVSKLKDWIIDSEMGGELDKTDTFYPTYKQLIILEEKIEEEEG